MPDSWSWAVWLNSRARRLHRTTAGQDSQVGPLRHTGQPDQAAWPDGRPKLPGRTFRHDIQAIAGQDSRVGWLGRIAKLDGRAKELGGQPGEIAEQDSMGRPACACVGHNYIGHKYMGHKYIGHNYIGTELDAPFAILHGPVPNENPSAAILCATGHALGYRP